MPTRPALFKVEFGVWTTRNTPFTSMGLVCQRCSSLTCAHTHARTRVSTNAHTHLHMYTSAVIALTRLESCSCCKTNALIGVRNALIGVRNGAYGRHYAKYAAAEMIEATGYCIERFHAGRWWWGPFLFSMIPQTKNKHISFLVPESSS